MTARTDGLFVGRDEELQAVEEALNGLTRGIGPPPAVLIVGEPGMGKTTLMHHVLRGADGIRRLRLAGFEPGTGIPLGAAAELFHVLRTASPQGSALSALLRPDTPTSGPLEPLRVFEAACAALFSLAPALVVFDDLQWADTTSVALVHYVLRAARSEGVSLGFVLASRPGSHLPGLTRALHESVESLVELSLGPLKRDAGMSLAQSIDPRLTGADALRLYEGASGSPFWIEAVVRQEVPPRAGEDVIGQRLQSLYGDPAECLAAIVVAARPITLSALAMLLGWKHERAESATASLIDAGLVLASGPVVRIVHDLVRETASRQIPRSETQRLHRRVAEWLERDADEDLQRLMEALAHRLAVGSSPLQLAMRIARSPQRRLLGADGLQQLAAIADGAPSTDPEVMALHVEVATIASELGERQSSFDRFVVLSGRLPTAPERARAALSAARQAIELQRSAEAAALIVRAQSAAVDDPWLRLEAVAVDHTRLMWLDGDLMGARSMLECALAEAGELVVAAGGVDALSADARRSYVDVLSAAWDVALTDDNATDMVVASEQRVSATQGMGEEHLDAAADAARMLWWQGRMQEAATQLAAVLDEARHQVYPALVANLCHALAYNNYVLGRLDEATALLDEAGTLELRMGERSRRSILSIRGGLSDLIDASRSDWRAAVESLRATAATYENPHMRLKLHQWAATTAARFGGASAEELVRAETEAALDDAREAGCRRCRWDAVLTSAESLIRAGAVASGAELLRQWDETHPSSDKQLSLERVWAHALVAAGEADDSGVAALAEVVDTAHRLDHRLDEVWARIDLGRAQAASGSDAAVQTWVIAMGIAEKIGASTELKVLQRELRSVGARTQAGLAGTHRVPGLGLTAREGEVVRLVASGRRNAEIAAALFLSPKTVERHLSNIFTKLGVRNRVELVAHYGSDPSPTSDVSSE